MNVFAVTETWLKPYVSRRSVEIPGFRFCRNDRIGLRGGGVGIYILNNIKYKKVFHVSDAGTCESLFVELYINNVTLLFGLIYLPHGDILSFENSHYNFLSTYSNIIIVGDFNCNMFDVTKSCPM